MKHKETFHISPICKNVKLLFFFRLKKLSEREVWIYPWFVLNEENVSGPVSFSR